MEMPISPIELAVVLGLIGLMGLESLIALRSRSWVQVYRPTLFVAVVLVGWTAAPRSLWGGCASNPFDHGFRIPSSQQVKWRLLAPKPACCQFLLSLGPRDWSQSVHLVLISNFQRQDVLK